MNRKSSKEVGKSREMMEEDDVDVFNKSDKTPRTPPSERKRQETVEQMQKLLNKMQREENREDIEKEERQEEDSEEEEEQKEEKQGDEMENQDLEELDESMDRRMRRVRAAARMITEATGRFGKGKIIFNSEDSLKIKEGMNVMMTECMEMAVCASVWKERVDAEKKVNESLLREMRER